MVIRLRADWCKRILRLIFVGLFSERNLVRTFFLALAILACGTAYASPWSFASFGKDVAFVVDLGSIEADKDIRSAWVLMVPMDPKSASAKSGVNHDYGSSSKPPSLNDGGSRFV